MDALPGYLLYRLTVLDPIGKLLLKWILDEAQKHHCIISDFFQVHISQWPAYLHLLHWTPPTSDHEEISYATSRCPANECGKKGGPLNWIWSVICSHRYQTWKHLLLSDETKAADPGQAWGFESSFDFQWICNRKMPHQHQTRIVSSFKLCRIMAQQHRPSRTSVRHKWGRITQEERRRLNVVDSYTVTYARDL